MTDAAARLDTPDDCRVRTNAARGAFAGRAALFLDRDGVLIEDVGYLGDPSGVRLMPRAAETVAAFNAAGVPVVVVTNQSGVGRGLYGWEGFDAVQDELDRRLAAQGAWLDAVFACGCDPRAMADHPWRKPAPGMILAAGGRLGFDLARSRLVGDRAGDIGAAHAAGLAGALLVGGGTGADEALALARAGFEVMLAPDVGAALGWLATMAGGRAPC